MSEIAKRANIFSIYLVRVRHRGDGALDARFAQQMQHGIRRTIGVILDVLGLRSGELILRMKTGHLQLSLQAKVSNSGIADVEKIVVLDEISQNPGMYQQ